VGNEGQQDALMANSGFPASVSLTRATWTVGDVIGSGGGGRVFTAGSSLLPDAVAKFVPRDEDVPREILFQDLPPGIRNVVPVIDSGETADHWVIVMPRAEMSLEKRLIEAGWHLPAAESLAILRDVATALADLQGTVVHRDVKPANILLLDGHWRLADFGIARYEDARTADQTRKKFLSRGYAAPERWRREHATHKADVYAWGVIAFQLLSGRRPFLGPDEADFQDQHLHDRVPPLTGQTYGLSALVSACLYKDPSSRPDATEVLDRLSRSEVRLPPGLTELARVNQEITVGVTAKQARSSAERTRRRQRKARFDDALEAHSRLSEILYEALTHSAAEAELDRSYRTGWRLVLGGAALTVASPRLTRTKPWPQGTEPTLTVAAHARIDLSMKPVRHGYGGLQLSYWFMKATGERYRWHETGFIHAGYPARRSGYMPFAIDPDAEACRAIVSGGGSFQVCPVPRPVDPIDAGAFVDRWARWFGRAARGTLDFPGDAMNCDGVGP
jgi:serine/threonine protein kinase